jgi:hypothetical protein
MFDNFPHFMHYLVEFGGGCPAKICELNHSWHGINVLSILECAFIAASLCLVVALLAQILRNKRLTTLSLIGALSFATAAYAANTALSNLSASGAIAGANLIYVVQTAGSGGVKATFTQVATYINSLFSGDATVSSGGTITLATVNSNVGSFGSSTSCITLTVNAKGLITAASASTCAPAIGSVSGLGTGVAAALADNIGSAGAPVVFNGAGGTPSSITLTNGTGLPLSGLSGLGTGVGTFLGTPSSSNLLAALTTKTGTGNAVFGSAPTIDSLNATTAMTLAWITGSTQCLNVNSSGVISGTGAVCGGSGSSGANPTATAGPTAVNGSATTFLRSDGAPAIQLATSSQKGIVQVDGTSITASSGVISAVGAVSSVTGGIGVTVSPTTGAVVVSAAVTARNNTATTDTITSTDKGSLVTESNASPVAAAITITGFVSTDYFTVKNLGAGTATYTPSSGNIDGAATLACKQYQSSDLYFDGTNLHQLASTCGQTLTIASGTATLGTSAISSGACGSATIVSAPGVATTDVITIGFNGDPTGTTGYLPTAMLTIVPYPTSGNINIKQCNLTGTSITPSALTTNWSVKR